MKAGSELDALIAEKVMGYRRAKSGGNGIWIDKHGFEPNHNSYYSTDIRAAWEVVEKIGSISIAGPISNGDFICCLAPGKAVARKTVPHAICIAALAAVNAL